MNKTLLLACSILVIALQSCSKPEPEPTKPAEPSTSNTSTTSSNAISSMDERFKKMTGPDGELESEGPVLTPEKIKEQAEKSSVYISTGKSLGTGWFVAPGWVVTNHHVIKNGIAEATAEVAGPAKGGTKCKISRLVADDPAHDLAIIELRYTTLADMTTAKGTPRPLKIASTDDPVTDAKNSLAKANDALIQDSLAEAKERIALEKRGDVQRKLVDDVPILQLENPHREVKEGSAVYEFGNPRGYKGTFSSGVVSGFRDLQELITKFVIEQRTGEDAGVVPIDSAKGGDALQYTTPSSHGSSGSALLNDRGRVIGVCFAGDDKGQDLNFAVPVRFVRALLEQAKSTAAPGQKSSP